MRVKQTMAAAVFLVGLGLLVTLVALNIAGEFGVPITGQMGLLLGGGVLVTVGAGLWLPLYSEGRLFPVRRWEIVGLGAVVILAAMVRGVALTDAVPIFVDELTMATATLTVQQEPVRLLSPVQFNWHHPWVYPYTASLATAVLGNTLAALRLPSAVVSTLAVIGCWGLARALFQERRLALVAALLLASWPPAVHMGRLALPNNIDAVFGLLGLTCWVYGLRRGGRWAWVVGGAALGGAHYFYEGGKLLLSAVTVVWLLLEWRNVWAHRRGMLAGIVVAVLIASPIYAYLWLAGEPLTQRLGQATAAVPTIWIRPVALLFGGTDTSPYYGAALVPLWHLSFFVLGLLWVVWSASRSLVGRLLVVWFALNVVGDAFVTQPGQITRYMTIFPAVAILSAAGLGWVVRHVRWRGAVWGLALVLVALDTVAYWIVIRPSFLQQYGDPVAAVLVAAADLPPQIPLVIVQQAPFDVASYREMRAYLSGVQPSPRLDGAFVGAPPPRYFEDFPAAVVGRMARYQPPSQLDALLVEPCVAVIVRADEPEVIAAVDAALPVPRTSVVVVDGARLDVTAACDLS